MATLKLSDINKSFGPVEILKGIDIEIGDKEFVALVGPSGCGKSTLLRMVAGLEGITSGSVSIGGRVVNDLRPRERDVAMVFQSFALYPHMTVENNMAYTLKLAKLPKDEIVCRIAKAAEILGLTDLLQRYPKQLSGGQRQRVAMGRAIVRDPKVFLFDEPLSNLDAKLRVQMRTEIKSLHQRLGTTTLYVTHDQIEAMTMADRVVIMNEGRIQQIGQPLELYDTPANLFVAGFIGSPGMNLLHGVVRGERFLSDSGLELRMPGSMSRMSGRRIVYGLRPESFEIGAGDIPVTIEAIEPTGPDLHLVARAGKTQLVMTSRHRLALRRGETVDVGVTEHAAHIFAEDTGVRVM